MTARPTIATLIHVWETLKPTGLPLAVIGEIALAFWRHVRFTQGVDLLVGCSGEKTDELIATLSTRSVTVRRNPPTTRLGDLEVLQLSYEPPESFIDVKVDLLLADSEYHRTALSRRVPVTLPDRRVEIAVLSCEDLIIHKLVAGRLIDRADTVALLAANGRQLNAEYLSTWITRLQLETDFSQVWSEACPGEASPVK